MARIGCAFLAFALGSCAAGRSATPPEPPARAGAELRASPTWKIEQSWTQLRAVAIDAEGRVGVVGHRLVDGDPLRIVGVVQVYDSLGGLAWERTIESSWVEGLDVAASPGGGFVVLMHEGREDADESVVYRFDADGTQRWRSAFDLGEPERPHDLAVAASGSIAFVVASGSPAAHADAPASTAIQLDEDGRRTRELAIEGEAVAVAIDARDNVAVATDRPSTLHVLPSSSAAIRLPSAVDHVRDLAPTPTGWMIAGEASDDAPIVVVDPTGVPIVRAGEADSSVFAIAIDGESAYGLGEDGVLALANGRIDPEASAGPIAAALADREAFVDIAVGPDGSIAFVGIREGAPWGRVDGWVVRLQVPSAHWPTSRATRSTRSIVTERARIDDARVTTLLRWLGPRGEDPRLPDDATMDRSVARALLLTQPFACEPWLADSGPDYRAYDAEEPGRHSTFDDPCLRLRLLRERIDAFTGEDLDALRGPLLALLALHGDDVHEEHGLGEAILALAFDRDRGPEWARATLSEGVASKVQRAAVRSLRAQPSDEGRAALREILDIARCDIAAEAYEALAELGDAPRFDDRSPGMTAEMLARRWCVLRMRTSGDGGEAFWAELVRGSYTYVEACKGDWPTRERESSSFDPCYATTETRTDPPREYVGLETDCDGQRCDIGGASYREGAPHGYDTVLRFARGRDGELYVDTVTVTYWLDKGY